MFWVWLTIGGIFILLPMCFLVFVNTLVKSFLYQPNDNYKIVNVDDKKMSKYFFHHQWGTSDGLNFLCLWQKNKSDCPTIVLLHGNASSIIDMLSICFRIYQVVNANIIVLSYPGYSGNKGYPSEQVIKSKLKNLMNDLINDYIPNNQIYLYGISFGGAVALYLSKEFEPKIKGLILENTFISINEMMKDVTGWSFVHQFGFLVSEKWDNLAIISQIGVPILFLCSLCDSVIPSHHMKELIKNTQAIHSIIRFDCDHNDVWEFDDNVKRITDALLRFLY